MSKKITQIYFQMPVELLAEASLEKRLHAFSVVANCVTTEWQ